METLVKEHDGVRSDVVRLGNELVAVHEARHAVEAWAKVFRQKGAKVEGAQRVTEGMVTELRASLSLLETARDAAHSKLHDA
jgi:hypothetical protein